MTKEIKKALSGKRFKYFLPSGGKPVEAASVKVANWVSYFLLFNKYKKFGLPYGKGWINELPWVIDFFSYFEDKYNAIKAWRMNKGSGKSSLSPGEVGL